MAGQFEAGGVTAGFERLVVQRRGAQVDAVNVNIGAIRAAAERYGAGAAHLAQAGGDAGRLAITDGDPLAERLVTAGFDPQVVAAAGRGVVHRGVADEVPVDIGSGTARAGLDPQRTGRRAGRRAADPGVGGVGNPGALGQWLNDGDEGGRAAALT